MKSKKLILFLLVFMAMQKPSLSLAQSKYQTSIGGALQLIPYWGYNKVRGVYAVTFLKKTEQQNHFSFFINYVKVGPDLKTSLARIGTNYNWKILKNNKWFDTYLSTTLEIVRYNYQRDLLKDESALGICTCVGSRIEKRIMKKWSLGADGGYGPSFSYLFNDYEFNNNWDIQYKEPQFGIGVFIHYNLYLKLDLN